MEPVVRILYLVRGVPGSGKTTYAKTLGVADHYEADMWFENNGGYDPAKIKLAHEWCQRNAVEAMKAGRPCVEYRTYRAMAKAECLVHHCRCCGYEWDSECESNPGADRTRHLVTGTVEPVVGQSKLNNGQ